MISPEIKQTKYIQNGFSDIADGSLFKNDPFDLDRSMLIGNGQYLTSVQLANEHKDDNNENIESFSFDDDEQLHSKDSGELDSPQYDFNFLSSDEDDTHLNSDYEELLNPFNHMDGSLGRNGSTTKKKRDANELLESQDIKTINKRQARVRGVVARRVAIRRARIAKAKRVQAALKRRALLAQKKKIALRKRQQIRKRKLQAQAKKKKQIQLKNLQIRKRKLAALKARKLQAVRKRNMIRRRKINNRNRQLRIQRNRRIRNKRDKTSNKDKPTQVKDGTVAKAIIPVLKIST
ncbi:uncharacterized protein LOC135930130 [Gordionus sp. m RMFG-2023]|uniref:uncharacterized protein LOC135930130 n=1 Tax=Gordionus sp. m RMFG-2023 TaxID=3053472 RepID=UPI0031FDA76D